MDQVARNNFGAVLCFDKAAPAPQVFHNMTSLAKQSDVSPRLVLLHPPELSTSSSRGQKKPVNIFKKLVPQLKTSLPHKSSCKGGGRHGDSGRNEGIVQKTGSWDVKWSTTPPSVKPSDDCSVESGASSSIDSPKSALIEALGLAFDRAIAIAIEPLSYGEGGQCIKFPSSNVKPTRSQVRVLRRKARHPQLVILSPPQSSQASPAPGKNIARGTPGDSLRRPSSSLRRTSRSLMVGHNPKRPAYTYRSQSQSILSSLSSIIQAEGIGLPLTGIHGRPSFRAWKRNSKVPPPAKLVLPPVEIHPLTFSPFSTEFCDRAGSDGGSSAPSTPSITTPPSDTASLAYVSPQKDIRGQKNLRRYGRCPSGFLNLGPSSPIASPIEQPRADIVLAPAAADSPTRFDSLRGCSRASLDNTMEVIKTGETKSVPSKASMRPTLTLQIPKTSGFSQRVVIHRPVASIKHCTDDIKINTRRPRPLPSIPITRQQSM